MTEFSTLLQQGAGNAWLFIPSALLLGALHGLEPGHSKTMMAAFIVAIRGSVAQAVMLGLAATVSHTAVVWAVALVGMHYGSQWNAETTEPYLQLISAAMIIGVALWMMWRTWSHSTGHHEHDHGPDEHQHDETKWVDTGHGVLRVEIHEEEGDVLPRFRIHSADGKPLAWAANMVFIHTERADGSRQPFSFIMREGFLESLNDIPEPHEFMARLQLGHGSHSHDFDLEYTEHGHAHVRDDLKVLDLTSPGYQDPHELAHANDIRRRFAGREVTNGQILVFGLTGGLIPCPASITVLLLCLQLKKFVLGATLVLCFSIGLAVTMVLSGVLAAMTVRHATKRWSGFGEVARKAPYFSGGLILLVGLYVGYLGARALMV